MVLLVLQTHSRNVLSPSCTKTLSAIPIGDLQQIMGPLTTYFQHPAHEVTPKAKAILVQADQVADEAGLDDEVIGGLMVGIGLK